MSTESDRRRLAERARETGLAVAADRERRAAEAERPLAPGDLLLDRSTAEMPVEWAVIDVEGREAGEPGEGGGPGEGAGSAEALEDSRTAARRLLIVPADSMPLRGAADVAVGAGPEAATAGAEPPAEGPGPLILRCAFGVWVEPSRLDPSLRGGRLPDAAVSAARERYREAAEAGGRPRGTPLEREAETDPEYYHWIETVLRPAREALAAEGGTPRATSPPAPPAPASFEQRRRRQPFGSGRPWAIAASVLLVTALGLAAGLLRQRDTLTELRATERRLAQDVLRIRAEQDALRGERERLDERLGRLAAEHRRELAEQNRAAEEKERDLLDRLADLQRRLREVATPRAWVNLPFQYLVPVEPVRGDPETVELPADADHLLLLLEYIGAEPFDSYRLELYRKGEEQPVWSADDLARRDPLAFPVALPRSLLEAGEYRLELFEEREGSGVERVAEYEVRIVPSESAVPLRREDP